MKIISFDIGIKNMAYCIFDLSNIQAGSHFAISDWKVANLIPDEEKVVSHFCTCPSTKKPKVKGQPIKPCGRKAKYGIPQALAECEQTQTQYLCDKHAKSQTEYKIPEKKFSEKEAFVYFL